MAKEREARGLTPARVISRQRDWFTVMTNDGERLARLKGAFLQPDVYAQDIPVVGDFVTLETASGASVIRGVLERKTLLARETALLRPGEKQPICANIDGAFLVTSLNADFNLRRLERYAGLVLQSGATPFIVLTKADLAETDELPAEAQSAFPGITVLSVSAYTGQGMDVLRGCMEAGKTYAVLGMSGVGKSTLLNALMGEDVMKTSGIREDDSRGRHTTTHRELFKLPNGALLIDTPGMRSLDIGNANDGVAEVFADIERLTAQCRYRDCGHGKEPGCAVIEAISRGGLSKERWESYKKLKRAESRQKPRSNVQKPLSARSRSQSCSRPPQARSSPTARQSPARRD